MLTILNLILGILLVLLLLSPLTMLAMEVVSAVFSLRAKHLQRTLQSMLGDTTSDFLKHPFLKQLSSITQNSRGIALPKLNKVVFADVLFDFDGNNLWYCDQNGWYYWSGGVDVVPDTTELSEIAVKDRDLGPALSQGHLIFENKEGQPAQPLETSIAPVVPEKTHNWQNPEADKLNWGVQRHGIAKYCWQEQNITGRGVKVALLGTGADINDPDLAEAVKATFTVFEEESVRDIARLGHQSAVIVGGRGHVVFGVALEAELYIGKIGNMDQDITVEALLKGLDWALSEKVDIIAILVDFRTIEQQEESDLNLRIERAFEQNTLLLAPVGNSVERFPIRHYPAVLEGILSVGSYDMEGKRSVFSAKSHELDLLAPGEHLLTLNPGGQTTRNLKTSAIATAFLAGFLALAKQKAAMQNKVLTNAEWIDLLRNKAVAPNPVTKGSDVEYGYGVACFDPQ